MRDQILERIIGSLIPHSRPGPPDSHVPTCKPDKAVVPLKTGTTVLTFKYQDGIIVAGDKKVTEGTLSIHSQDTLKIGTVTPYVALCYAGVLSECVFMEETLRGLNNSFIQLYRYPLSIAGQAAFAAKMCRDYRFAGAELEIALILAGYDMTTQDFAMYNISWDGYCEPINDYFATGSGGPYALATLDQSQTGWKKNMNLESSIYTALSAIYHAAKRDNGTGDPRIALPDIAMITSNDGITFVEKSQIKSALDKILSEEEARKR